MPAMTIDGRPLHVELGTTILEAARTIGIEIPTLCFLEDLEPGTHCMVCVVKVAGLSGLVPACGTMVREGMQVESGSEEVRDARRTALELLLSDHVGDCIAPCQLACPAHMNIPRMIRHIVAGDLSRAIEVVKQDIALPAVLGRICPAPCEKACTRGKVDKPVAICLLKRFAADTDLAAVTHYRPQSCKSGDQRVAIVGAGPAGLAAAYYLQDHGFVCTIFDDRDRPGGMLRYGVPREELPQEVLDHEIALVAGMGVLFRPGIKVGRDLSLEQLRCDYNAVFVAIGASAIEQAQALGLAAGPEGHPKGHPKGLVVDAGTYQTNIQGVFAGGDAVRGRRLAVRSVADGKEAALCIRQFLAGGPVKGPERPFNTRMGALTGQELEMLLSLAGHHSRVEPTCADRSFTPDQAGQESQRCLHCDCRKADACKLRQYSRAYDARPTRFKGHRRPLELNAGHPEIVYESGKCIDCGLCVRIAELGKERLGLAFVGRGFDVRVAVPFDAALGAGLTQTARQCAEACPTGALAFKDP